MKKINLKNIFTPVAGKTNEEYFEKLIEESSFFCERIISEGHTTPEGQWYDQETNEFVLLLKGTAELEFEKNEFINLKEGDYIVIPKHKKHRVNRTDSNHKTFWLTIHYK